MARHKIGTVDREGVFIRVEYGTQPHKKPGKPELTISADIRRSGHWVAGGQSIDTVRRVAAHGTLAPGWTYKRVLKLCNIWERWHLNGLRPGCEHQRALGWTSYDDHPSEPCPICGYKYGTAWHYEPLPQDVIEFVKELT